MSSLSVSKAQSQYSSACQDQLPKPTQSVVSRQDGNTLKSLQGSVALAAKPSTSSVESLRSPRSLAPLRKAIADTAHGLAKAATLAIGVSGVMQTVGVSPASTKGDDSDGVTATVLSKADFISTTDGTLYSTNNRAEEASAYTHDNGFYEYRVGQEVGRATTNKDTGLRHSLSGAGGDTFALGSSDVICPYAA